MKCRRAILNEIGLHSGYSSFLLKQNGKLTSKLIPEFVAQLHSSQCVSPSFHLACTERISLSFVFLGSGFCFGWVLLVCVCVCFSVLSPGDSLKRS